MDVISKVPYPVLKMFCSSVSDLLSLRSANWALCKKVNSILVALAKQFDEQKIQVMTKEIQTIHQDAHLSQDQRWKKIEELKFGVVKCIIKEVITKAVQERWERYQVAEFRVITNAVQDMKNQIDWGLLPIEKQGIEQTSKIIKKLDDDLWWPVGVEELLGMYRLDFFGVQDPQVYAFVTDLFWPRSWKQDNNHLTVSAALAAHNQKLSQVSLGIKGGGCYITMRNANLNELMKLNNLKNLLTINPECKFLSLNIDFQGFHFGEKEKNVLLPLITPFENLYINNFKIEKFFDFQFLEKAREIVIKKLDCEESQILRFENFQRLELLNISSLDVNSDPTVLYKNCPNLVFTLPTKIRITAWCNTGWGKSLFFTGKSPLKDAVGSLNQHNHPYWWPLNNWCNMHSLQCLGTDQWVVDLSPLRSLYPTFSIKFLLLDEHDFVHWQKGANIDISTWNTNDINIRDIEFEEIGHPKSDFFF